MNARDEFPWPVGDPQFAIKQHGIMCRKIDTLTAELAEVNEEHHATLAEVDRLRAENADLTMKYSGMSQTATFNRDEASKLEAELDRLRVEVAQLCDDRDTFRQALVGIARAVREVQAAENRGCSEDELEPFDNVYVEAVVDAVTLVPDDEWKLP